MPGRGLVRDRDKGYKARVKGILALKPTTLTVGIHADEGNKPHEGGHSNTTVLDIGTIHEFGLGNAPERSFIRGWADENEAKNAATIRAVMASVASGKRKLEDAADVIGLRFKADIQRRIRDRIPPPNAQETIDRKGSDVPLIASGQLRSAIEYKVGYGRK